MFDGFLDVGGDCDVVAVCGILEHSDEGGANAEGHGLLGITHGGRENCITMRQYGSTYLHVMNYITILYCKVLRYAEYCRSCAAKTE